jgi:hypothetical protein
VSEELKHRFDLAKIVDLLPLFINEGYILSSLTLLSGVIITLVDGL